MFTYRYALLMAVLMGIAGLVIPAVRQDATVVSEAPYALLGALTFLVGYSAVVAYKNKQADRK